MVKRGVNFFQSGIVKIIKRFWMCRDEEETCYRDSVGNSVPADDQLCNVQFHRPSIAKQSYFSVDCVGFCCHYKTCHEKGQFFYLEFKTALLYVATLGCGRFNLAI